MWRTGGPGRGDGLPRRLAPAPRRRWSKRCRRSLKSPAPPGRGPERARIRPPPGRSPRSWCRPGRQRSGCQAILPAVHRAVRSRRPPTRRRGSPRRPARSRRRAASAGSPAGRPAPGRRQRWPARLERSPGLVGRGNRPWRRSHRPPARPGRRGHWRGRAARQSARPDRGARRPGSTDSATAGRMAARPLTETGTP